MIKENNSKIKSESEKIESHISVLDLSVRAYNTLCRHFRSYEKTTVGDVANMSDEELLKVRNLGGKCAKEVREKIKEYLYDE